MSPTRTPAAGGAAAVVSLEASYATCRALARRYGTTYFWATQALPAIKRPHVYAVYGFCRYADDIVDALPGSDGARSPEAAAADLAAFGERFFADLEAGSSTHPVLKAVVHTTRAFGIDPACYRRFLRSMTMDLTVTSYATYADLDDYMDGSAAVIGEMMLPILEPTDLAAATQPARDLGVAFQLTNFLRDVGEDLQRGRVYLPQEDLDRFGADPWRRRVDGAWQDLMRFEIDRTRALYRSADDGLSFLSGRSARCIRAARVLYSRILDRIEAAGYDVFAGRARVPTWTKVGVVGWELARP